MFFNIFNRQPVEPPWIVEGKKVFGLHESRNNAELRRWLVSDGKTLGDPKTNPWCFTGEVEIMTEDGWQRFDNLTSKKVYQAHETGKLSLTDYFPVTKTYSGKINVLKHRSFTLRCDPDHRWWGQWGTYGRKKQPKPLSFGTLSDMTTQGVSIPVCHSGNSGCGLSENDLTFLAAALSDGCVKKKKSDGSALNIVFEVSRSRKIQELNNLEPDHHYTQSRAYGPLTKTPFDVFTFKVPSWWTDVVDERKELKQSFVNTMSKDDARIFLNAYRKFDGAEKRFHLYTSSPVRRDNILMIAAFAGYQAGVSIKQSQLSTKDCYEIHIEETGRPRLIYPKMVHSEDFDGTLYCVQVPKGRIVVREAGKGAIVTGNCGDYTETAIKNTLPKEPFPNPLGQNPYWARNWLHFGVSTQPCMWCVMVFSRDGGGHVGFAVGEDATDYYVLGGNQSDSVNIVRISKSRLLGCRWPSTYKNPNVPLKAMSPQNIPKSTNEF
jgi:hypothetical protein